MIAWNGKLYDGQLRDAAIDRNAQPSPHEGEPWEPLVTATYFVKAHWDAEASVWVSQSDIPGLVIEAETLAEFEDLMMSLAPEMLAANTGLHNTSVSIQFDVSSRRDLAVA